MWRNTSRMVFNGYCYPPNYHRGYFKLSYFSLQQPMQTHHWEIHQQKFWLAIGMTKHKSFFQTIENPKIHTTAQLCMLYTSVLWYRSSSEFSFPSRLWWEGVTILEDLKMNNLTNTKKCLIYPNPCRLSIIKDRSWVRKWVSEET